MKLVYISHWRFPSEKTMTPLILRTCEEFAKLGWEVELWAPRRLGRGAGSVRASFPVRYLPVVDTTGLGAIGFVAMVAQFNVMVWLRFILEPKGTVLYGHDMRDFILPALSRPPIVVEIHDFYESSLRWINRYVLGRISALVVTNRIKMQRLGERYGVPAKKMLWQPNAVDAALFDIPQSRAQARDALGLPQNSRVVLYTGHLFGWKGVHTLADAAAFVADDIYIYFVGGTAEDRTALQKYVAQKNLPHITFVAHQPHDKIPLWQRAADVLVLPNTAKDEASRVETSPVKLFEYLASGTPIVTSYLPSIREIVSEREVVFAQPDDPRSFAHSIQGAIHSPDPVRIAAAQALARQHGWASRAQAIDKLIRANI